MKTLATILAGAALALTGTAAGAQQTLAERGEAKLSQLIAGRAAGAPQRCISTPRSNRLEVIDYVGVVYDAGETVWVSRPADPRSLGRNDVLVVDRFGSQLCNTDAMRTVDRYHGHVTGVVFLGDFVPYRKAG